MISKEFEVEIGGKKITAMFTDLADQANGSVILKSGGTVVMATACISRDGKSNPGFFNLTVEYLEKFYAAGKILGSQYMRREGRPSDQAILAARVIDRTIRPLFDHRIKNAVQVIITVIAVGDTDPKMLGVNAASVALHVSDIPWAGPVGGVHISTTKNSPAGENSLAVNNYIPANEEPVYALDLMVCGKENTINMIESMAFELDEATMGSAFDLAMAEITKWEAFQKMLRAELGKEKMVYTFQEVTDEITNLFNEKIIPIFESGLFSKTESKTTIHNAEHEWKNLVEEKFADNEAMKFVAQDYIHTYLDKKLHEKAINNELRPDMRGLDEVRALSGVAGGISDVLHGSGIFYRGETHVMSVLTLGGPDSMHSIDGIENVYKKRFMHHYNFPPYSAGETGRVGGINRREMGHGFLAEKAMIAVLPSKVDFPYTIRVVSESTASNGSTSQASICAMTIAMMDGGVPIKNPVAGISIGAMIDENDNTKYKLITDIQGPEDHYGDMDFKVAGTTNGITAIQLDIKVDGVPVQVLKDALGKAKIARLQILEAIKNVIAEPRTNISTRAPKIMTIKIKKEQIGMVIGPAGKNINAIREATGTEITIEEDGTVYITGRDGGAEKAHAMIAEMTYEYKAGDMFKGEVIKIVDFGAFVKINNSNTEGLVHVSEMAPFRVEKISDILKEGEIVPIKVLKVDEKGKISLSIKEADKDFFNGRIK